MSLVSFFELEEKPFPNSTEPKSKFEEPKSKFEEPKSKFEELVIKIVVEYNR
jgi:hypothetical protein